MPTLKRRPTIPRPRPDTRDRSPETRDPRPRLGCVHRESHICFSHMSPREFDELKKGSAETLVLAVLEDGARHGYDLAREIDRRSGGRLVFHVATLYTTLYRMERNGVISGRWVEKAGQRRRRFYRLTRAGRARLLLARRHWQGFG